MYSFVIVCVCVLVLRAHYAMSTIMLGCGSNMWCPILSMVRAGVFVIYG